MRATELLEQAERQIEAARAALRVAYTNGYCPDCGAADPDDDGHRPECRIGAGFEALAALEDLGWGAALAVVEALIELRAAETDLQRIGKTPFLDVVAERPDLAVPASDAPIEVRAEFGDSVYRPYRARVATATQALEDALAVFDAGPAAAEEAKPDAG